MTAHLAAGFANYEGKTLVSHEHSPERSANLAIMLN